MVTIYFIFYLLIHSINSNPIVRDGNDICQINGYFVPSNGYRWIERNNQIICTCPDFRYEINQPCRICNRPGICGPQDALCSEEQSNFISINNTSYITCFCSSGLFLIGDKCPQQPTTIGPLTTTTTIQQTNTISTTTTLTTTTSTTATLTTTNPTTTTTAITTIPVTPSPPPTTTLTTTTKITTTITTSTAEITTISMSTTVSTEAPMSVSMSSTTPREQTTPTTMKDTTTNTTASPCDVRSSSSYLFVKPLLIILLNLVYFVNK